MQQALVLNDVQSTIYIQTVPHFWALMQLINMTSPNQLRLSTTRQQILQHRTHLGSLVNIYSYAQSTNHEQHHLFDV